MPVIVSPESQERLAFFDKLWGNQVGYICIATKQPGAPTSSFTQKFFEWPKRSREAEEFIQEQVSRRDVYFGINLLEKEERKKETCIKGQLIWADFDEVDPRKIDIAPPIVIGSSDNRYQAIWRLSTEVEPWEAENYSRRVAYKYGADKNGWDLTQLLRVPGTFNFKYNPPQVVKLLVNANVEAPLVIFENLPVVSDELDNVALMPDMSIADVPKLSDYPQPESIIYKYTPSLGRTEFGLVYTMELQPTDDWSRHLWRLINVCLEVGMTQEEAYVVVRSSSVNKYERDNRPPTHLWRDILKAYNKQARLSLVTANFVPLTMPQLVENGYEPTRSFVTEYRQWGELSTDAVPQFHDLCAFVLLSAIVANGVKLMTSYGPMIPNLWGMILGDSTLTRKTTAMRMVMEILNTLNQDIVLGTDGSVEGLLSGLQLRPNRTSVFFRDELSGFFDAINRKDYLAGMPETFTHLYDVPQVYQRLLRKETIRLESPIFIFLGGGVRDKVYEVTTEEYVISGFLPRFLIVSGDANIDNLRRTGPATDIGLETKARLINHCADLYEHYAAEVKQKIAGETIDRPPTIMAKLTPEAWETYGDIEDKLVKSASKSAVPYLALPTFERLSRSALKMSMILAASRQQPDITNQIEVTKTDVTDAAFYIELWGGFSVDLVMNCGKGMAERVFEKIVTSIKLNPGVLRSTLMTQHHLTKKQADDILGTLEERVMIVKEKRGRGTAYYPV